MKQKEVKNKRAQRQLANELMADLKNAVDCFSSYEVEKEQGDEPHIVVRPNDLSCGILTSAVVENVMEVLFWYRQRYEMSVRFWIDVVDYRPQFSIRIEQYIVNE